MNRAIKSLVLAALFLPLAVAPAQQTPGKKIWAKSFLGQKGPELVVQKWLSEKPDTKDRFILIDFWATWCGPCRKAVPHLNAFHKEFGERLLVIGVSAESEPAVRKMTEPKIEYFSAVDPQKRTYSQYEVKGIPHVVILDPQGIVRWEGFPFLEGHELTMDVVRKILEAPSEKDSKSAAR